MRTRKFVGMVASLLWLIIYSLVFMAIGGAFVVGRGMIFELPFYVIAGVLWIPVEMIIIRWMSKPDDN